MYYYFDVAVPVSVTPLPAHNNMDDDDPPSLSSLQEQVQALEMQGRSRAAGPDADEDLPTASTTIVGSRKEAKPATNIKRGFFDAKPKPKPSPEKQSQQQQQQPQPEGITVLKGKKGGLGGGPDIPDFLRVEPDAETKRLEEIKGKLKNALQPTPDTIAQIGSDPALMSGFDDPEVMAAVAEIAKDPSKMNKYKDNRKVQAFYSSMAKFAGTQLEQMGSKPL